MKIIDNFLNKIRAEDGLSNNTLLSYRRDLQILQNFL
ncbi:MAG: recombinase XerD, partial [Alphaproteobacteria bacterium]|nr:recombinase XerD [Alphaproteobacteria bacterium]